MPCVVSAITVDSKRQHYRGKISQYMDRAEKIKEHVNQAKEGSYYTVLLILCQTYHAYCHKQ